MILIDKDELLKVMSAHCANCKKRSDYYPSKCKECDLDDGIDVIECSTTVEAIPVSWLERNYANNGLYCTEKYKKRAKVVKEIIDDWRARQCG